MTSYPLIRFQYPANLPDDDSSSGFLASRRAFRRTSVLPAAASEERVEFNLAVDDDDDDDDVAFCTVFPPGHSKSNKEKEKAMCSNKNEDKENEKAMCSNNENVKEKGEDHQQHFFCKPSEKPADDEMAEWMLKFRSQPKFATIEVNKNTNPDDHSEVTAACLI